MVTDRTARILCLDDEPVGLSVRKAVLEKSGYAVVTACTVDSALGIFLREQIDLVISDHFLSGTVGTRVAAAMKELNPNIPILILSGATEIPEGMEHADAFLPKLEPPRVLLETIAKLLTSKTPN